MSKQARLWLHIEEAATIRTRTTRWLCAAALLAIASDASAQACLEAHLNPSDPWPYKNFAWAVDLSTTAAVIGAMTDNELGWEAGAAYIFVFDGEEWTQSQKLLASDGGTSQLFGRAVAIEESTAVIASTDKAYVFTEVAGEWIEQQILVPADGTPGFGQTVALDEDVIVVANPYEDTQGLNAGAAWVFRHDGLTWIEEQKLLASDGAAAHFFGAWPSVAVQGDLLAIGALGHKGFNPPKDPPLSLQAGAAYVFQYDGNTWKEHQIISPFDVQSPLDSTNFGKALDLYGDLLVVSNTRQNNLSTFVYRYEPGQDQWVQEQQIMPPPSAQPDGFGRAIAVETETILIGDWLYPGGGTVFVYEPDGNALWQVSELLAPDPNPWTNFFGWHIGIEDGRALVSALGEDQVSGAAYIFDLDCNDQTIPGDVNGDGVVDILDLLILLGEWGACTPSCAADLTNDGVVDVTDLLLLLANWG